MADPTTHPQGLKYVESFHPSTPIIHGVEKATQTYKLNAPVIDDDAGRITESTSPIDGSAVAKRCIGLAVNAATGTTGADVVIVEAMSDVIFEGTLTASGGSHTLAQADQWQVFPLAKDTVNGNWFLDGTAGTKGALVIGFVGAIGDVDARVRFLFTTSVRGVAHASSDTF